jgi:endonuclease YncB( thermonuclease family)
MIKACLLLAALAASSPAAEWGGINLDASVPAQVVRVIDGDTLVMRMQSVTQTEGAVEKIGSSATRQISVTITTTTTASVRLLGIDAWERGDTKGRAASEALARLIKDSTVQVVPAGYDKYGRMLGVLLAGNVVVNEWLLQQGHATTYPSP